MPNTFLRSQTLRRYCLFESYRKMSIQHRPYPGRSHPMTLNPLCSDRTSQGILVSQTLATTQAIQAFFHRLSVAVPGAAVPLDMRTLGIVHIFPLEHLTAPMVRHLSFNQPRFA